MNMFSLELGRNVDLVVFRGSDRRSGRVHLPEILDSALHTRILFFFAFLGVLCVERVSGLNLSLAKKQGQK
jgi:hypothetical protein